MKPLTVNPNRPPSYMISARIEPDVRDGLDRWARATGVSLSIIIRCLLKEGVSSLDEARNGESPPDALWNIAKHYDESRAFPSHLWGEPAGRIDGVPVERGVSRDKLIKLLIEELQHEK